MSQTHVRCVCIIGREKKLQIAMKKCNALKTRTNLEIELHCGIVMVISIEGNILINM